MTDGYRLLLHQISAKLDERDLKSLISLCNVCESRRAEITDGMKLFEHLIQRDVISKEKINELKELLQSLSPERRDLVNLVNMYQGLPPTEEDHLDITVPINPFVPQELVAYETPCCILRWPCLKASFYKVHSCYVVLLVVFVIAIVIWCSFWYGNVPQISKYLSANEDVKNAGIYVLVAIILVFFPLSILCVFYGRKYLKRHEPFTHIFKRKGSEDAGMNMCSPSSRENPGSTVNEENRPNPSADTGGISLDLLDKERIINIGSQRPVSYQQLDGEEHKF